MVQHSPSQTFTPPTDLNLRRGSGIAFIALLILYARPFTPGTWLLGSELGALVDALVSTIIYLGGLYFQWVISAVPRPLLISIPTSLSGTNKTIQGGRVVERQQSLDWVYNPMDYWKYLGLEGVLLVMMWATEIELVFRACVCVIFVGLWGIGWFCVPESTRQQHWAYIKELWVWMVVREVLTGALVRAGGGGRRRR